jgi:hypothetical protein
MSCLEQSLGEFKFPFLLNTYLLVTSFLASQHVVALPVQLAMGHRRMSQEAVAVLVDIKLPRTTFDRNGILALSPSRVGTAASVSLSNRLIAFRRQRRYRLN